MMTVVLSKQDYDDIVAFTKKGLPNEACGLLGGVIKDGQKIVKKVYYLRNTDESPEHFSMDVKEQFAVIRDIRKNDYVLLGNFHSHPNTPSRSSQEDIRLAFDPNLSYLILSLAAAEPVLHSFHVEDGVSTKEPLVIQ